MFLGICGKPVDDGYICIFVFLVVWVRHPASQWWKTESISLKIRKKTKVSICTTIIQHKFWKSYSL